MSKAADLAKFIGNDEAGKLGQVLTQTPTSSQVSATSSYVDTGLSINITPASTSSKILVMAVHNSQNSAKNTGVHIRCFKDSTQIGGGRSDDLAFFFFFKSKEHPSELQ